mmetsp:Transcript_21732/g.61651  ORF Transcript_21732/g.61651 Transcript_21732/m.61651 type:complete len:218 (-) Transcript_21732:352-1005(-)
MPWQAAVALAKSRPFSTYMVLSTSLGGLADYSEQVRSGKPFDSRRSALFFSFSCANAFVQYGVYFSLFSRLFPKALPFANSSFLQKLKDRPGQLDLLRQCSTDLLIYMPFVFFPFFYIFKGAIQGGCFDYLIDSTHRGDLSLGQLSELLRKAAAAGLALYIPEFQTDNLANMYFWGPGDIIVFTVPGWLRMPLCTVGQFFWFWLLSWMRGAGKAEVV